MKNLFTIFLTLLVFGCASTDFEDIESDKLNSPLREIYIDKLQERPTGKFHSDYIPLLFSEPKDVREARHKMLSAYFATSIQKSDFIWDQEITGDWEVSYHYSTSPAWIGRGFDHTLEVELRPSTVEKRVSGSKWIGIVTLKNQESSDISIYLPMLAVAVFQKYPYKN